MRDFDGRMDSVYYGKDAAVLDFMLGFYAPDARVIVDVCCNRRRIWKGSTMANKVTFYDIDPQWSPDCICSWDRLPNRDGSVDVLVYDPPHLPLAAASKKSIQRFSRDHGLKLSTQGDNVVALYSPFLREAGRVLKPDGLVFAKIKDYVHNHKYQWNVEAFNLRVREVGLTPCDLIIKRDPSAANLKSGRWKNRFHVRNAHCYWVIVRQGRCEPRRRRL